MPFAQRFNMKLMGIVGPGYSFVPEFLKVSGFEPKTPYRTQGSTGSEHFLDIQKQIFCSTLFSVK